MSDERATGAAAEHLARIRETLESGSEWGCLPTESFVVIEHHAEALAALAAPATGGDARGIENLSRKATWSAAELRRINGPDPDGGGMRVTLTGTDRSNIDSIAMLLDRIADNNAALRARLAEAERKLKPFGVGEHPRPDDRDRHIGGLSRRLAEAEARLGRWESYWLAEQHDDTPMTDWLARVKAAERKLRECGDLPDAKGGDG